VCKNDAAVLIVVDNSYPPAVLLLIQWLSCTCKQL